nr:MAG TPA: hypothetical protein [Caudoviricetes sp.]
MTEKEYDDRLSQIEKEYKKAKENLVIECAKSNNPYNIGDIITNGCGIIIKIEKNISSTWFFREFTILPLLWNSIKERFYSS